MPAIATFIPFIKHFLASSIFVSIPPLPSSEISYRIDLESERIYFLVHSGFRVDLRVFFVNAAGIRQKQNAFRRNERSYHVRQPVIFAETLFHENYLLVGDDVVFIDHGNQTVIQAIGQAGFDAFDFVLIRAVGVSHPELRDLFAVAGESIAPEIEQVPRAPIPAKSFLVRLLMLSFRSLIRSRPA